jgi:GNAT superfamily N-acetyltransferase
MIELDIADIIDEPLSKMLTEGLDASRSGDGVLERLSLPLSVTARDGNSVLGGLTGKTVWGWLHIERLWVDPKARRKGLGRDIMRKAEAEALARGCHSSYLWTESFQVPEFYKKQGYKAFAEQQDFPPGHTRIGFQKRLCEH